MEDAGTYRRQLLGSLLVAALLVAIAIVAVTAKLGPTSVAEEEARIERQEQRFEQAEELRERRQELREQSAGLSVRARLGHDVTAGGRDRPFHGSFPLSFRARAVGPGGMGQRPPC
jgi:hypothetical protein